MHIDSANAASMRNEIYQHMLATRGDKYRWFLRGLRAFKYISLNPARGTFLESYYTLMRYVDDVVDGDAPLPVEYSSTEEFVDRKIRLTKRHVGPSDASDHMLEYCMALGEKFGHDFSTETLDILTSMLFDARRHGTMRVFSEEELQHHFHLLDVRGTISATLKVFGEQPAKYPLLQPLGCASRIYYNLRDYDEDIKAGLVNVSAEDRIRFGIRDLEDRLSTPVQDWMHDQAQQGIELIKEYRKDVVDAGFGWLVRITLPIVYEQPALRYFESILSSA
jgi:hypothetical protein